MSNKSTNKEKETSFIVQGGILALASVMVRIIGLVYRIPMTNILGDGISVYSTAYSIYSLIWMIASFGIPTAVSRMVAQKMGRREFRDVNKVFYTALLFATIIGGVATAVLFFGSGFFANVVFKMPEIKYALMILAPTVWISTFMGAFRGFYQGLGTMIPTAISQIAEQVINAIMSIVGSYYLYTYGESLDKGQQGISFANAYGAAGGTIGTAMGALAGLLICVAIFIMYRPVMKKRAAKDHSNVNNTTSSMMKILVLTILPITLNSATYNISSILDNAFFGNYMTMFRTHESYLSMWTAYEGKYHLLTHVPLAFATALSASAVPNLSKIVASNTNKNAVSHKIQLSLRFALLIAIPSCVGLCVLAEPVLNLLFSTRDTNPLAAELIQLGCITVVMYSFSTITNGILQGIGRVATPAKNALVALIGHLLVLVVCLWGLKLDVYGVVISDIVFGLFMNILNYRSIRENMPTFRLEYKKSIILPLISSLIMGVGAYLSYYFFMIIFHRNSISVLGAIIVAVIVYFMALILTKAMDEKDLVSFPKGRFLVRLAKKMHLL